MEIFKRFFEFYKPHKRLFFFDLICATWVAAVDLSFPQLLYYSTHVLFVQGKSDIFRGCVLIAAIMIVLYAIRYYCQHYITTWGHIMGARMESEMRKQLFEKYQALSFSYYDRNNTGIMMSKLVSDLFDISELAHHGPENVFLAVMELTGAFVLMGIINVYLAAILFVIMCMMLFFGIKQNRKMKAIFLDNRKKIADVNSSLQDSLAGIRVVKSFGNEKIEHEKFQYSNNEFLHSKTESYMAMGRFVAGGGVFVGLSYMAVLSVGGYFIGQNMLQPTDLAVFALYIGIFLNPINMLVNFTEQFQKGYTGFCRFVEIMDTPVTIKNKADAQDIGIAKGDIDYKHVFFHYEKEQKVLEDIDFHVDAGKTIALVGPSGGGKTTICSLLPRFYDVTKGSVCIDGKDVRDITLESLRRNIGIVQQDVYMFNGTIKSNIAYGKPDASFEEIMEAAKRANIHDFIMTLPDKYDSLVGERGTRLSGGQKQRISIARVFLKNPRILILDEATSALDNESERYIKEALELLAKDRTTIVVAHRLSTIQNADEILVIRHHNITERGNHDALIKQDGLYARYYRMQFHKQTVK
ncbi:ABC transporter ATP-binding protein [Pectinatus cerevisiiphilus]|uniref:ATP-binding cassette subfamily B protein n=1 Tax=Pectinatus cerevisiiphilus TaxID=86956 RepID=A0A4R3K2G0_9FIRM|nr:ABC transporter ATP-binding protein [Pectinatus cerevisiiphilus]TCS76444.1 ATP-binding cassette subfamily B protein [Pectinatus cerevisiiphilus]